jgi:hypothetical protein
MSTSKPPRARRPLTRPSAHAAGNAGSNSIKGTLVRTNAKERFPPTLLTTFVV